MLLFDISLLIIASEEELGNAGKWKESLSERIAMRPNTNLTQLVYGQSGFSEAQGVSDEEESEEDEFLTLKGEGHKVCFDIVDSSVPCAFF